MRNLLFIITLFFLAGCAMPDYEVGSFESRLGYSYAKLRPGYQWVGSARGINCQAFLVNSTTAVTAGHCIPSNEYREGIRRGYYLKINNVEVKVTEIITSYPYEEYEESIDFVAPDVAILKIPRQEGYSAYPTLYPGSPNVSEEDLKNPVWTITGKNDIGRDRLEKRNCNIKYFWENGFVATACKSIKGDSGSPVFMTKDNRDYFIGVLSGVWAEDSEESGVRLIKGETFFSYLPDGNYN